MFRKMFRKLKWRLCLRFPRFKLYCIRRALHLEKRKWQTDFALGRKNWLPTKNERANGKTTAVLLRMLMKSPGIPAVDAMLWLDPDYKPDIPARYTWYYYTYQVWALKCLDAGIPVPKPYKWRQP